MNELEVKLDKMKTVTRTDSMNPRITSLTKKIVEGKESKIEKINAIYNWVNKNIKYRKEKKKLDIFIRPIMTLRRGYGDCEDITSLIGAMALSIGLPVEFRVIRQDSKWQHIYPVVAGVPVETTVPVSLGREVNYTGKRIFKI